MTRIAATAATKKVSKNWPIAIFRTRKEARNGRRSPNGVIVDAVCLVFAVPTFSRDRPAQPRPGTLHSRRAAGSVPPPDGRKAHRVRRRCSTIHPSSTPTIRPLVTALPTSAGYPRSSEGALRACPPYKPHLPRCGAFIEEHEGVWLLPAFARGRLSH